MEVALAPTVMAFLKMVVHQLIGDAMMISMIWMTRKAFVEVTRIA